MNRALIVVEPGVDPKPVRSMLVGVADHVSVVSLTDHQRSSAVDIEADDVLCVVAEGLESAESAADAIAQLVDELEVDLVILPATARFREVFPLLGHRLDAACVSDVLSLSVVDGVWHAERLLYGGVAVATVALHRRVAIVTVPATSCEVGAGVTPRVADVVVAATSAKTVVARQQVLREVALASAERLVSFGRGVRTRDDVAQIEQLAALLKAQIGCSRPVVEDLRWLTVDHQVGLTGTTVKPELYLAIGISGQIQHLVGMRDSKVIVAINNNAAAPIFTVADIGVVGDLYDVVPRLISALSAMAA